MKFLFVLSQLILAMAALGQGSEAPLRFKSFAISLGVAKDESLALATKMGEVGVTGSITGEWRRVDIVSDKGVTGVTIDRPSFFNKDTGFVSGFIHSDKNKYDIIYRTTDGGQKWQVVNFGQDGWIDDAIHLDNGEAWLSVSGSGIAYSVDYGLTWKKFNNPEPKQRFVSIYFNTGRQGIMGSLWNTIVYTADNCNTWKLLPTPLDQKKYNKTNKESRPDLRRVAIYKDYFLAVQEGLVFYTKRDSVNWIWLPDYNDLYTDPENSALFFKKNKGGYVRADDNFKPVQMLEADLDYYDAICKNGSLFVVFNNKMVQMTPANTIVSSLFEEKNPPAKEPVVLGYNNLGTIGYLNNKIFVQKLFNGSWDSLFTFPVLLAPKPDLSITREGKLLYHHGEDSLFYFNFTGELEKRVNKNTMVAGFAKSGIKQIVFSQGSQGCFHNMAIQLIYTNLGDVFGQATEMGKGEAMPESEDRIDLKDVSELVNQLPAIFNESGPASIGDLGFSESDYRQCQKDILEFQASLSKKDNKKNKKEETGFAFYRNNLDFDRLLNLVDSIKNIDKNVLYNFLMHIELGWSTTTNWKKVAFINYENEVLSVTSRYYHPNSFYFPWIVELNGHTVASVDFNINRFFERTYPAFLKGPDKVKVLHEFVKRLY